MNGKDEQYDVKYDYAVAYNNSSYGRLLFYQGALPLQDNHDEAAHETGIRTRKSITEATS
jgi:hypothetical protein